MRIARVMLPLVLAGSVGLARVELKDDPPPVPEPKPGDVTGTIEPASKVAKLQAVSRNTLKTYTPESFDRKTGRFRFAGLPDDADYDVRIETADGRTIEGIDLAWIEARMVRLAALRRKDLGLPPEREHQFSMDDVNELLKWVEDWKDFMELKRVLYVQGHGQRATMLVELMRTRAFHASAGSVVWRMELWYMKNEFGGWDRLANAERVLHRRRINPAEWRKIDLQYFPELSAHVDADGRSKPLHFKLPAKADLSRGRLPNTGPNATTKPHIRGLDVKPEKPVPGFHFDD